MSVQRVPAVPFAQIANEALRDRRLSFRARGILALVLSHSGEWTATLRWLESQSEVDGRAAIQSALRELTSLGYRIVTKERVGEEIRTVVEWRHTVNESISRRTENLTVRIPDGQESGASIEHHSSEHHREEHHQELRPAGGLESEALPVPSPKAGSGGREAYRVGFDAFWSVYPRKAAKPAARRAFEKALAKASLDQLIRAAERYRDDPNREEAYTAHAATWLNNERWMDGPLPTRRKVSAGDQRVQNYAALYDRFSEGREIEA